MNLNKNNNNFDSKNIMNFLPGMTKTKSGLRFLVSFLFGIAPLIIECLLISPDYLDSSNIYVVSTKWLWLIGFFTFLIVSVLIVLIVKFSRDIKQDVIAQTLSFSFSSMFILATPALQWWETMFIFLASLLVMTAFFQILIFVVIGVSIYRKIKKSTKDIENGNFDFSNLDPSMSNMFVNNPEMMQQMKSFMDKNKKPNDKPKKEKTISDDESDKDDDIIDI